MIIKKLFIMLFVSMVCISNTFAIDTNPNTPGSIVQKGYNRPSGKLSESNRKVKSQSMATKAIRDSKRGEYLQKGTR